MVVDRLPGLFGDFESDRPACLALADRCPIRGVAVWGDIVDFQAHNVAAPKLAVDRDIEERKIASSAGDLKPGPDRPNVFGLEWRFGPGELPLVPGHLRTRIAIREM